MGVSEATVLLERVATGDAVAFARLYELAVPRLVGLAVTVVGDHHHGEDIAQDVMAHVWAHPEQFTRTCGDGWSWLLTLTHRRAIDLYRAQARRRDKHQRHATLAPVRCVLTPEDHVLAAADRAVIYALLDRLTDRQRRSVAEVYYRDRSQPQAALAEGVPLPTFKSRLQGALTHLRRQLAEVA